LSSPPELRVVLVTVCGIPLEFCRFSAELGVRIQNSAESSVLVVILWNPDSVAMERGPNHQTIAEELRSGSERGHALAAPQFAPSTRTASPAAGEEPGGRWPDASAKFLLLDDGRCSHYDGRRLLDAWPNLKAQPSRSVFWSAFTAWLNFNLKFRPCRGSEVLDTVTVSDAPRRRRLVVLSVGCVRLPHPSRMSR
jgi:hypothetical protein